MGIDKIKDYFVSMEHIDGRWVVSVRFQRTWSGYSSDNGKINAVEDEDKANKGLWWYFSNDTDASPDEIFSLIEETVNLNIEMEKKAELFTLKASELKDIFSDAKYSYDDLKGLSFTFRETISKPVENVKETKKKPAKRTKKDVINAMSIKNIPVDNEPVIKKENVEKPVGTPKNEVKPREEYDTPLVAYPGHEVNEILDENNVTKVEEGAPVNATDMTDTEIDDLRG